MIDKETIVERHIPCPDVQNCGSSDAYCLYKDGHGHCFSCNLHTFPDKEFEDLNSYTYEYLPWRGLSKETMKFYDIKTKINAEGKPVSIGYPYANGSYKVRDFAEKAFHSVGDIAKAGLFGKDKFSAGAHKSVTITEGEIDAASLYQVVRGPVVSVQSSSTGARDCAADRSWLNSFERIYLAFDGDAAGRECTRAVARLFDYNKVYVVRFTRRKDANEYVSNGEDNELLNIWTNSKKYLPEHILSSFDEFKEVLAEKHKDGIPYPFKELNELTYGIRTGESVLITAQEGVGKTEVMHAIEHKILKETEENVAAIFLEEPKRRHLQAVAGVELRKPVHLPDCDVTEGEIYDALTRVVQKEDRLHVYSHFGSDDPESLLDTIRFLVSARGCRYVLLDHISMAVSGLAGEDERRALDYLSTRLEMLVKELDFALIFVAHVNDFGQTRGSRYIGKIADIRIDITRDLLNGDPKVRNTTHLMVAKNRFSGRTGSAGNIIFDPLTYTYREEWEDVQAANDNRRPSSLETVAA